MRNLHFIEIRKGWIQQMRKATKPTYVEYVQKPSRDKYIKSIKLL